MRTAMLIALALLETASIYVLLVVRCFVRESSDTRFFGGQTMLDLDLGTIIWEISTSWFLTIVLIFCL